MTTSARWDKERGSGGMALGWIIAMTAVLALVFSGIQYGLFFYAESLALSAAQAGVRAASLYPPDADRGRMAAENYLAQQAKSSLTSSTVNVSVGVDTVTVIVTGSSNTIVPGIPTTVTQQAAGPLELVS